MQSTLRKPRAKVTANGTALRYEYVEVVQTTNHTSDSFLVRLPLFDPKAPFDWIWWASQTTVEVEISVGFEDDQGNLGSLTRLILGTVERLEEVPLPSGGGRSGGRGAFLEIIGGDYSRVFQNSPFSQQFVGGVDQLTSSQIIQQIVDNHPQITLDMSAVSDNTGAVYDQQQGQLFLHRSEWDVITALADHEGWTAAMSGTTLVIKPNSAIDSPQPYKLYYNPPSGDRAGPQSNCEMLRMARALNIAQGVKVTASSYDAATGNDALQAEASTGDTPGYNVTMNNPGMDQDQLQQSAQARADLVSQFEREIEFAIPGDPTLTVDTVVSLSGTGTAFDQSYYPDSIRHEISMRTGYLLTAVARNRSQSSNVTAPTPGAPPTEPSDPVIAPGAPQ